MSIERTTPRDWFWPVVFLLLGAAGVATAYRYFFQAFPEASIDLRLTKEEIARRSTDFLRGRNLPLEGYRRLTTFDFDDQAKTYLERELGLEEANRLMSARLKIWRWNTRLFKPPQKEEITVWMTPAGEPVGFEHEVEEARGGAKLEKEEAQRIAELFLRAERRLDLARYKLVTDDLQTRPNRRDYTFTWEEKDFKVRDATLRLSVTVLGDEVGGFREFLKIPEQWTRDYQRLRSRNNLLQTIATTLYIPLMVAAIIVTVRSARRKKIHWKAALAIGAVVGFLFMVQQWNDFALQIQNLPTNAPYQTLAIVYYVIMVVVGLFVVLYILLFAASGEALYRELSPDRVSLNKLFTFPGLRSKEFFTSTLIGYGMAGMHIGLVVLFYVLARRLGAWAPLDVNYNNAISTALPWIYPLATSVFAATSEEFAFRLLAIPLLLRLLKSRWLAVIIPAFMWGFLHSAYPQQPAWIRGVEVGLIGIVAGWVFLRFGILATLVWHYTVDAVLIGMFLLRSENISYRLAGALVGDAVLLPLIISIVFYVESRGFLRDEGLLNRAEPAPAEAPPAEEATGEFPAVTAAPAEPTAAPAPGPQPPAPGPWEFIPPARMRLLALAGLAGLAAMILVNVPSPGRRISIRTSAAQAESVAVSYLAQKGVKTGSFRRVTWLENNIGGNAAEYLRENGDTRMLAHIYDEQVPSVFWRTRFFRPLEKEEYSVWVSPNGKVARYSHQKDEKAPGARLEKPEAQGRAEAFLRDGKLAGYGLMEHTLERRDNRNDHTLVWEAEKKLAGEATHRLTVALVGDEVTGPDHWIKIPEEWVRRHTRLTVLNILPTILFVGLGLAALWLFIRSVTRRSLRWRLHFTLGGIAAGLQFLREINGIPAWAAGYSTSVPWSSSMAMSAAGRLILVMATFVGVSVLAALAEGLLSERFGSLTLWPPRGPGRGRAILEALVAGAAGVLLLGGARNLLGAVLERIPSPARGIASGLPGYPVSFWPGLAVFLEILTGALWAAMATVALAALLVRLFRNRTVLAVALLLITAVLGAGPALSGVHFLKNWASVAVALGVMAAVVLVLRFNPGSYLALFLLASGGSAIVSLWRHPGLHPVAQPAAAGLILLVAIAVWWARNEAVGRRL